MFRWLTTFIMLLVSGLVGTATLAAPAKTTTSSSTSLSPEALGSKAFLEDLLARRYSQELATFVDRESFYLGAQLELTEIPPVVPQVSAVGADGDPMSDLMLGSLDPDAMLKNYVGTGGGLQNSPMVNGVPTMQRLLANFKIKSVTVSVGLKEELSPETKAEVEAWLAKRVQTEFGKSGNGAVTFIKVPQKKHDEAAPKNYVDWLMQFQSLAGQAVMAFAILVGLMMFKGVGGGAGAEANGYGSSEESSDFASLQAAAAEVAADNAKSEARLKVMDEAERIRTTADIDQLTKHLIELVPRLSGYFDDVVRNWCHMGDAGRFRLACFAEVAGRETGKLPIPVDALQDVQKVFARMPEISIRDKRDALQKAYWDLLSTLNLGSESLSQPFAYLDGLNVSSVSRVLMSQNPRLRTVVSLYMTDEMRGRYIQSLPAKNKVEMLGAAAELFEIRADELETFDRSLLTRINPARGQEIVPLELSFNKIVASLTVLETITMLPDLKGNAIDEYKRTVPSVAFLADWPDDHLKMLLMGVTPDEIINFLRMRPDLQERFLGLASMMVGEIAAEELQKPDKVSAQDREQAIMFFNQRLSDMVSQGDISLVDIFGPSLKDTVQHLEEQEHHDVAAVAPPEGTPEGTPESDKTKNVA